MPSLTTKDFQIHIAEQFIESLSEPANNTYYMFVGRPIPWNNDNNPPEPEHTVSELSYAAYDDMVFGKIVTNNDIKLMGRRYDWESGTVYTAYDDKAVLANTNYFVCVNANTSYHVFKCLGNSKASPSTVAPAFESTSADDEFYQTSDGYQWKYLYTIDSTTFNRFATPDYVPYVPNAAVSANAIPGAIDTIVVDNAGTRFNSYANGYFVAVNVNGDPLIHTIEATSSSNTDFYKNSSIKIVDGKGAGQQRKVTEYIVSGGQKNVVVDAAWSNVPDNTSKYEIMPNVEIEGDGFGAQARAIINPSSNTIQYIEITSRGASYSWATATVQANTGIISSNSAIIANNAVLRVIIGPAEGHGGNIPYELGMNKVGLAVSFANTESGTIPAVNKFRTVGLIRDPLFDNVSLTLTDVDGNFVDGEVVISETGAEGIVTAYDEIGAVLKLTDVRSLFTVTESLTGVSSNATAQISGTVISGKTKNFNTFDQRYRFDVSVAGNVNFIQGEIASQETSSANGYVHEANATFVALTNTRGVFNASDIDQEVYLTAPSGAVANVVAIYKPDIIKSSGKILYIENTQPIQRSNTSTETIKLVIGF